MNALIWVVVVYLVVAALVYAGAYLYGNSQGGTPTQTELLKVALPWPYVVYLLIRARSQ